MDWHAAAVFGCLAIVALSIGAIVWLFLDEWLISRKDGP